MQTGSWRSSWQYSILCAGLLPACPEGLLHFLLFESTQWLQMSLSTAHLALLHIACGCSLRLRLHVHAWALLKGLSASCRHLCPGIADCGKGVRLQRSSSHKKAVHVLLVGELCCILVIHRPACTCGPMLVKSMCIPVHVELTHAVLLVSSRCVTPSCPCILQSNLYMRTQCCQKHVHPSTCRAGPCCAASLYMPSHKQPCHTAHDTSFKLHHEGH